MLGNTIRPIFENLVSTRRPVPVNDKPLLQDILQVDLNLIRKNHPWAVNFSDDILLRMLEKNPRFFDVEPNPLFVYGEDPITGKVIPAVGAWSMPVIGIIAAVFALALVSKMR